MTNQVFAYTLFFVLRFSDFFSLSNMLICVPDFFFFNHDFLCPSYTSTMVKCKLRNLLFAELKAEASIMDQLSSSDSSSDSKSSSSSSSSSENSSSESEDEEARPSLPMSMPYLQPQPAVSAIPHQALPDKDASHNRSQENSGHMMNTLRKYKDCSFLSMQFQTSRF